MSRVIINAISVREGGALVVLKNLLTEMARQRPKWQWHVATNEAAGASIHNLPQTICHIFPESTLAGWKVLFWYELELLRLIKQVKPDLLFSQTNYLPVRKLPCPALLLVQHAGHFSDRFSQLTEIKLAGFAARMGWRFKTHWVKSSVRRAQAVTVQTEALARSIVAQTGIPAERVQVVPHGIGQVSLADRLPAAPRPMQAVRIGYITKYGVQKNFPVLFQAVAELKARGVTIKLVLTLAPELLENKTVLSLAEKFGILECLENHGELVEPELSRLYNSLHMFAFPSWCESFGFPVVEAMAHGLPLLVADTRSNTELAGAAGLRFSVDDASALAFLIQRLIEEPKWHLACAAASRERAEQFSWQTAAAATLSLIDKTCIQAGSAI